MSPRLRATIARLGPADLAGMVTDCLARINRWVVLDGYTYDAYLLDLEASEAYVALIHERVGVPGTRHGPEVGR